MKYRDTKRFPLAELEAAANDDEGFCVNCGTLQGCVEPDARNYKCEACGALEVFGAEELIMMELISDL